MAHPRDTKVLIARLRQQSAHLRRLNAPGDEAAAQLCDDAADALAATIPSEGRRTETDALVGLINRFSAALRDYEAALARREHGDVAASKLVDAVRSAFPGRASS